MRFMPDIDSDLMRVWAQSGLEKMAQDAGMLQDDAVSPEQSSTAVSSSGVKRKAPEQEFTSPTSNPPSYVLPWIDLIHLHN